MKQCIQIAFGAHQESELLGVNMTLHTEQLIMEWNENMNKVLISLCEQSCYEIICRALTLVVFTSCLFLRELQHQSICHSHWSSQKAPLKER